MSSALSPGQNRDDLRAQAPGNTDYEVIDERSLSVVPLKYTGLRIKLRGQVTNLVATASETWLTLRIGAFPTYVTVVVRYPYGLPHLQKDMTATTYGVCAGTERVRYPATRDFIGMAVSRPLVRAEHIEVGPDGCPLGASPKN